MHVLLDATAVPADRGGVGRYVDELVPELDRSGIRLTIAAQARDAELFGRIAPRGDVVAVPATLESRARRMLWEQTGLPALARRVRPDVVHSPHYTMPLATRVPVVVTLHDATFFTTPELHLRSKAVFFRNAIRVAARRAAALVTPSKATRDEVVRLVGADPARFHVAYHGVDHDRFHAVPAADAARVRATLDIGDAAYVGFLGTLEPRKNVPALVRGWVRACADLDDPPALVLAGGKGWDDAIDAAVAAVPARLTVRRPGYLPLDDLPGFLAGATVLAYPSLGEGFGLPVLEAMACGATVLTTRELSLPEVGGDAVAYCGTDDASIGAELRALIDDGERRSRLATAAVERAGSFTWEAAAAAHVEAYDVAAHRRP
ncbi:glycosyltransferase family 1 protein [Xylanimonas allomyrinae]|uniref:Glycosyltransferase family 1 protein n=1 Tax=Xylanimonas allomyrinae TaxID=2509459 RepID=A0A4P6EKY1_9MICO|nr:glycosyltransferase family 1 protein [Xylanimonas allomyrinae]QAY63370.1 glycosyltransferase family 1 protein [Xylanimonas allomyrinae]